MLVLITSLNYLLDLTLDFIYLVKHMYHYMTNLI